MHRISYTVKFLTILIGISILCFSCDSKKKVREFALNFAQKAAANQIDSLVSIYPGIIDADSIALQYNPEEIQVIGYDEEEKKGQFDVILSPLASIHVNTLDDGSLQVTGSVGIFAYPDYQTKLAATTGLWYPDIPDNELARRIKDENFYDFLADKTTGLQNEIITVSKLPEIAAGSRFYVVTNNTAAPVDSADYQIRMSNEHLDYKSLGYTGGKSYYLLPGRPISPRDTVHIPVTSLGGETVDGLKIKISQDKRVKHFATYSGKEYQQYLDSLK